MRAWRCALRGAAVLAALLGSDEARAQSRSGALGNSDSLAREVTVTAGKICVTVSRTPGKPVRISVRTDSGTFTLAGDSAVLAQWADSIATLPEPPAFVEGAQVSFKIWQVKADGGSGAHMRFARMPTDHGAEWTLALSNGAWGDIEHLGPQAADVIAVLRGDSSALADTAHVKITVDPVLARQACASRDSAAGLSRVTGDSSCSRRHVAKMPKVKGGSQYAVNPIPLPLNGKRVKATFSFVIDTTGRADPTSIRLLSSTNPVFALACRQALSRMEFRPARVDGRNVRALVEMPFEFGNE